MFDLCSDEEMSELEDCIDRKNQLRPSRFWHHFLCSDQHAQIHPKVVEKAIHLLKNVDNKQNELDEKDLLNKRISNIENTLEIIVNRLNDLLKK